MYSIKNISTSGRVLAACMLTLGSLSAEASVVIQEVLYDGPGTDSDDVFTELYGTPGTDLNGWSLAGINGSNGEVYRSIDLSGGVIPGDGVFVIATSSAHSGLASVTDFIANIDWQNGPDAIQLFNGAQLIDALQYGDAGAFNAGEGNVAADITGLLSLSRDLAGSDTNDNALDFSAIDPTPGSGPAVVPIPAAAWLFGSALVMLGRGRRRR